MTDVLLIYTTWPDLAAAEALAAEAVADRLAACANIFPGGRSIFRWQGAIETASETVMILKTTRQSAPALRDRVLTRHPHETPCVLALAVDPDASATAFVTWIAAATMGSVQA